MATPTALAPYIFIALTDAYQVFRDRPAIFTLIFIYGHCHLPNGRMYLHLSVMCL